MISELSNNNNILIYQNIIFILKTYNILVQIPFSHSD